MVCLQWCQLGRAHNHTTTCVLRLAELWTCRLSFAEKNCLKSTFYLAKLLISWEHFTGWNNQMSGENSWRHSLFQKQQCYSDIFSAVGTGVRCRHSSFPVSWIAHLAVFPEWYNCLLDTSNYGVSCPNFSSDIGIKKIDFWNQVAKQLFCTKRNTSYTIFPENRKWLNSKDALMHLIYFGFFLFVNGWHFNCYILRNSVVQLLQFD